MTKPHILIVGAGIGGLTTAIALLQQGASVEIFEQAASITEVGAGLQLGPNAMKVLDALGLSEQIGAVAFEPEFTTFRNYKSGKAELEFPMGRAFETRYGAKYLHIHRADLHKILLHTTLNMGAQVNTGTKISTYTQVPDFIEITSQQESYSGDILIGADGIHSKIQTQIIGPQAPRFTGQVAWRGTVPTSAVPKGTLPRAANNWMGPGQHFVSYYIRSGQMINFVAVKEQESWTEESWQQAGNMEDLCAAFAGWNQPVTAILDACEHCYLWGLFDRDPLPTWTDGRAALLGDAAHPMLPFAAQGAAMAIEDSWVLAQKVMTIDNGPSALKAYEQARKPRVSKIQKLSSANAGLYHQSGAFGRLKRRLIFGIGSRFSPAQNYRLDPIFGVDVLSGSEFAT